MDNNRNEIVDYYKGFLMWGVILGHTITALKGGLNVEPILIHTFLRTYDMPFFMIMSGFFLSKSLLKHGMKNVLMSRITMILYPIILWSVLSVNFNCYSFYFLWAVFISSIICIFSYSVEQLVKGKNLYVELIIEISCAVTLYFVDVPWNLFYLYPFFIFGMHLKNIDFRLSNFLFAFILFVFALCFWKDSFSPWVIKADAWRIDKINIFIYIYRFLLGVLGTYVIANILKYLRTIKWGGNKLLVKAGTQTLSIYILQTFVVEKFLNSVIRMIVEYIDVSYSEPFINLIGYVIAPVLSFIILIGLLRINCKLKEYKYTKNLFGCKLSLQ